MRGVSERGSRAATDREQLVAALRAVAAGVLEPRPDVQLAYLYGSVARGQSLPSSDIDIGVVLRERLPAAECLGLELELEHALAASSGLDNVDVRVVSQAPLLVQGAVATEGMLLYARDDAARVAFETQARSRYFDFLPTAQAMAATFGNALAKRLAARGTAARRHEEWPA